MDLHRYRVRPGRQLPHEGLVLEGGAEVDLPRHVAHDVRHLVDPIDAAGQVLEPPTPEAIEVEARPAHEQRQLLEARRTVLMLQRADAELLVTHTREAARTAQCDLEMLDTTLAFIDRQLAESAAVPAPPPAPVKLIPTAPDAPAAEATEE